MLHSIFNFDGKERVAEKFVSYRLGMTNIQHLFKALIVIFLILSSKNVYAQEYVPPIGIPAPEFGINETVENVYGSDTVYTHYVDNTHPNATDTDNPYGTSQKPRKTIPRNIPAGSVVEIHGGPYVSIGGTYTMQGTADKPVFVRGIADSTRPQITKSPIRLDGSYFIVENLDFYDKSTVYFRTTARYGSLRHSEVHNPIGQTGASNPTVSVTGKYIVVYDCEIHDNIREPDVDCHGIQASNYGEHIWILENNIYKNGGDGIQACHMCDPGPRYLYIGGNRIHRDAENAIDLKYARDVIISENKLYDYLHSSNTGIVSPIVVGSDGAPTRVWILFNEIYDAKKGIRIEEVDDVWIIGNVFHDLTETGIIPEKKGTTTRVINNTFYNVRTGISEPWRETFSFLIYNNIFASIESRSIHLGGAVTAKSEISNNLFWDASIHGENAVNADPMFKNISTYDFSLLAGSSAIDSGVARGGEIYDYLVRYGQDIGRDFMNEIRPQGNEWDIGAYEYVTGTIPVQYEITAEVEGTGGSVWPQGGKFTENTQVQLTARASSRYRFDHWSGDTSGTDNPLTVTMNSDKTISAVFKQITHFTLTVHVSGRGRVDVQPDSASFEGGTEVTLTAVPDSGEQFIKWKDDLSGTANPQKITMDTDKTVTAVFTPEPTEDFVIDTMETQTGSFEAEWTAYATADKVDGVIGFSEQSPSSYGDLSCKILFNNSGYLAVSDSSAYTSDASVAYTAFQKFHFRMSVDISRQTYSVWVTPEGENEILLADEYAFHPSPGYIDSIKYRSVKMSFDPQWGGAEGMVEITDFDIITGFLNDDNAKIPEEYSLNSYPNPFNSSVVIRFGLLKTSDIELSIYNALGQKITTLLDDKLPAGSYKTNWNALGYASGIYIVRLQTSNRLVMSRKIVYLK
ncbi:MAG TPA: T9SS type A sorting domain-containing protein [Caldithrix abyssi]|uniref:T9SS type A sorting domain-containing protein n=1 Tax=Caldithrix abyssi TaxID=187145 RepID=A0A7V4UEX1_CALAY|nr:T9SS type A sorting domain-containing protein [Caldithrix abyssi]